MQFKLDLLRTYCAGKLLINVHLFKLVSRLMSKAASPKSIEIYQLLYYTADFTFNIFAQLM